MAVADVSEYMFLARDGRNDVIATGAEPHQAHQQVVIGAEAKTAAFQDQTRFVRVHVDAACRIAFGSAPTASSASKRMAANSTEFFGVIPGHKISFITST
jgi:hypothetical protein